jgi:hypothetical protein
MPDPDLNLLLHGSTAALPDQIPLRAGPLTLIFEAGDLRYISLGPQELVRRTYGPSVTGSGELLRDNRRTCLSSTEDGFTVMEMICSLTARSITYTVSNLLPHPSSR